MSKRMFVFGLGWALLCTAAARAAALDPGPADYVYAKPLAYPAAPRERTLYPQEDRANFTFFHGVKDHRVEDGKLVFTLDAERAVLGWGNYMGRQSLADMAELPERWNEVVLEVEQSEGKSTWRLKRWRNGRRADEVYEAVLEGTELEELHYGLKTSWQSIPTPDGLEFEIEGEKGTQITVHEIRVFNQASEGYYRKAFSLPDTPIWKAVAEIGGWGEVYLNEQKLTEVSWYAPEAIDIRPYLRTGRNVLAVHGFRWTHGAHFLFQCRVVLRSGEVVTVKTDPEDSSWRLASEPGEDWRAIEYDHSAWGPPQPGGHLETFAREHFYGADCRYHGRATRLVNPMGRQLFYATDGPVVVEVLAPVGYKDRAPMVDYVFSRTDEQGDSHAVDTGTVTESAEVDDSLVFRVNAGPQRAGVYTLAVTLRDETGTMEARPREPLVVQSRFEQPTIAGDSWHEGLELELEDTIDVTDPGDPHPWISATPQAERGAPWRAQPEPQVVTRDGLTYQVAPAERGGYFAYRVAFERPGSFYLIEVDYPDDAQRVLAVVVGRDATSESGVGAETGGRLYTTGEMQTLRFLHGADSGPQMLIFQNHTPEGGEPAAASRVRIYRVTGELPSVGGGSTRSFGILTERCIGASSFGRNFGADLPGQLSGEARYTDRSLLAGEIQTLRYLHEAVEKYIQYLTFSGQNTHIMGVFQYSDRNTAYRRPYRYDTPKIQATLRDVLAHAMDANGMTFHCSYQWCEFTDLRTDATDAQVAKGADTVFRVNEHGEQKMGGGQVGSWLQNWLHPRVQERFREEMHALCDKFGHLDAFKGLRFPMNIATGYQGYYPPGLTHDTMYGQPLKYSYDDVTFAQFSRETGIDLPVDPDDPHRFAKRAQFVRSPAMRPKYIAWRCRAFRGFLELVRDALRERKADAQLVLDMINEDPDLFQHWLSTGRPYKEWLRDYAVDIELLDEADGMSAGRWTLSWRDRGHRNPYMFLPRVDPRVTDAYSHGAFRHVHVRTSWLESGIAAPGEPQQGSGELIQDSDWVYSNLKIRALPQPAHVHAREAFLQALITGDPNHLTYGFTDLNLNSGHEQAIRKIMRVATHLPSERFAPVLETGLHTNLAIRKLVKDQTTYLYVANPGYWGVRGGIVLSTGGAARQIPDGTEVALEPVAQGARLPVSLPPYGLAAYRLEEAQVEVRSFAVEPIGRREQTHMQSMIDRVAELLDKRAVRIVLGAEDEAFMRQALRTAREALQDQEYAQAWDTLIGFRLQLLWKHFLEKADRAAASLPKDMERAPPQPSSKRRALEAVRASGPITVDGELLEADWGRVPFAVGFRTKEDLPGMAETGVKAVYDDENVYLAFACADPRPHGPQGGEEWSWNEDDGLVVFLQPDLAEPVYYQLGFNTGAGRFHQKVVAGERLYELVPGWKAATRVQGVYWTAEVAFPFAVFGQGGRDDEPWGVNVHRLLRDNLAEPSSWFAQGSRWHLPEGGAHQPFGRLVFQ